MDGTVSTATYDGLAIRTICDPENIVYMSCDGEPSPTTLNIPQTDSAIATATRQCQTIRAERYAPNELRVVL